MRRNRLKLEGEACYHVINKVHDSQFMFDAVLAAKFVELMRKVEVFTGVEVLTYCVMSNHFHLLVQVPTRREVGDEELLARYEHVAGPTTFRQFKERWDRCKKIGNEGGLDRMREQLTARMYDLSMFMKELKQRFTQWYNWREERVGRGTFWTDRYKSVLVEGGWRTLATMAAYIDLNPVRAGMVEDPKAHRWSGYGAAAAGEERARQGLKKILGELAGRFGKGSDEVRLYEVLLFGKVVSTSGKAGLSAGQLEEMFGEAGMRTPWIICRERVRKFSEGIVVGSKTFEATYLLRPPDQVGREKAGRLHADKPPDGGGGHLGV
jgi:putative transposase